MWPESVRQLSLVQVKCVAMHMCCRRIKKHKCSSPLHLKSTDEPASKAGSIRERDAYRLGKLLRKGEEKDWCQKVKWVRGVSLEVKLPLCRTACQPALQQSVCILCAEPGVKRKDDEYEQCV